MLVSTYYFYYLNAFLLSFSDYFLISCGFSIILLPTFRWRLSDQSRRSSPPTPKLMPLFPFITFVQWKAFRIPAFSFRSVFISSSLFLFFFALYYFCSFVLARFLWYARVCECVCVWSSCSTGSASLLRVCEAIRRNQAKNKNKALHVWVFEAA